MNVKNVEIIPLVIVVISAIEYMLFREWNRWQELYNTVPRCTCQYRSQERLQEVRDNRII